MCAYMAPQVENTFVTWWTREYVKWLVLANVNKPWLQRLKSPGLMGKSRAKSLGGSFRRPHTIGTELIVNFIEKEDITDGSELRVS